MGAGVPIDSQVRIANCRYIVIDLFIHDHEQLWGRLFGP